MSIDPTQLNFDQLEQQNGLPAGLLTAVMNQESSGNPNAVSPKGAQGLFQLMPATAQAYGVTDPNDPVQSANAGAKLLGDLSKQYKGDLPSVLAAYNWGSGNLDKHGIDNAPAETKDYVSRIQGAMGQHPMQLADAGNIQSDAQVDNLTPEEAKKQLADLGYDENAQPLKQQNDITLDQVDNLSPQQAKDKLSSLGYDENGQPIGGKSLGAKISDDFSKREGNAANILKNSISIVNGKVQPTQSSISTGLQLMGEGAGAISDTVSDAFGSAFPQSTSALQSLAKSVAATKPVQAVASAANDFAQAHPITAANAAAVGNIVALSGLGEGVGAVKDLTGDALSKVGNTLYQSGANSAQIAKTKFAQELITPKLTPTVKNAQFTNSVEQGALNTRTPVPTPQEKAVIDTVASIPGVSKSKSLNANYKTLSDAFKEEATTLASKLQDANIPVSDDHIINGLSDIRNNLAQNIYISGDGAKSAEGVVNGALAHIANNPQTAAGLLQARKDFDKWLILQKGSKIFNPAVSGPVDIAVQQVRQGINNMIASAVPDAGVKASLQKQFNIQTAMKNIATKGGGEAPNAIGRGLQKVSHLIPVKSPTAKAELATGAAALLFGTGAGAVVPIPAALGLAGYGAYKGLTSPAFRKGVGASLRTIGNTIK